MRIPINKHVIPKSIRDFGVMMIFMSFTSRTTLVATFGYGAQIHRSWRLRTVPP
jgi:hypothetical protein